PLLRAALKRMGRKDLIGNSKCHLVPTWQPAANTGYKSPRRKNSTSARTGKSTTARSGGNTVREGRSAVRKGTILTQHSGLPPRRSH
ncbi:MAG: DUF3362 domain-containing protein, partial [bacterium]